ncbi:hypothetical protein ACIOWK_20055 [Pseudomonas protegens]|uniref:hypothetical protein n=1 Tax=Pseudomonas protegens TaxID=380021 RepID=UPI0038165964
MSSLLTHWCCNCDTHYTLREIRHCIPVSTSPEGEEEILQCPTCGSYDIKELQEMADAT